jgi:hypothetical protein
VLNLNDPDDARAYMRTWVDKGDPYAAAVVDGGTDSDVLRLAYQLFVFCDPHVLPNEERH